MYYVIYSTNPWLLARLATDLQMSGVENDENWNEMFNPFSDESCKWMAISPNIGIYFNNHKCEEPDTRFTLTERNYLKVLETITEPT